MQKTATRVAIFGLARDSEQALRVVEGWRAAGFSLSGLSLLARYRSAKTLGDAIARAADEEEEGREPDPEAWAELDAPAVMEVNGAGPLVAAGPASRALALRKSRGGSVLADTLRAVGIADAEAAQMADRIRSGAVLVGMTSSRAHRLEEWELVLTAQGVEPLSTHETESSGEDANDREERVHSDFNAKAVGEMVDEQSLSVPSDRKLSEAMIALKDHAVSYAPVVDEGRMVGVLTAATIPIRSDPPDGVDEPTVGDVMVRHFNYCYDDQTTMEVASLMDRLELEQLPVLSRDGAFRGLLRSKNALLASDPEPLSD